MSARNALSDSASILGCSGSSTSMRMYSQFGLATSWRPVTIRPMAPCARYPACPLASRRTADGGLRVVGDDPVGALQLRQPCPQRRGALHQLGHVQLVFLDARQLIPDVHP